MVTADALRADVLRTSVEGIVPEAGHLWGQDAHEVCSLTQALQLEEAAAEHPRDQAPEKPEVTPTHCRQALFRTSVEAVVPEALPATVKGCASGYARPGCARRG